MRRIVYGFGIVLAVTLAGFAGRSFFTPADQPAPFTAEAQAGAGQRYLGYVTGKDGQVFIVLDSETGNFWKFSDTGDDKFRKAGPFSAQ